MRYRALLLALCTAGLLAGCGQPGTTVQATDMPPTVPPLRPETMPKPPVTPEALMWQPGHWDWTGTTYVWQPGEYVPAAGHGNLWMPGYWARTPSGWSWQAPHWTS
jgi:hypothetical protein